MENVLSSIENLRFCFTDILLILDVPHGGDKHGSKFPGGPGGYSEFLSSTWGKQMIGAANKTAQAAVTLLQSRCPLSANGLLHPSTWKVDILNYDDSAMSMALKSDFDTDADGFLFSSMYPNTMVYDRLWHLPDTQYVVHGDADMRFHRIAEGASPNFIEASITLMRSDSRVMMTKPSHVAVVLYPSYMADVYSKFDARWHQGEALSTMHTYTYSTPIGKPVSTSAFVMDVQKSRRLLPFFDNHSDFLHQTTEEMETFLTESARDHDLFQVTFDCSTNIIQAPDSLGHLFPSAKSACAKLPEVLG